MRAKDSDIFAVGSPLPGAAIPSNGVGVTEQSGSSPVGGVDSAPSDGQMEFAGWTFVTLPASQLKGGVR